MRVRRGPWIRSIWICGRTDCSFTPSPYWTFSLTPAREDEVVSSVSPNENDVEQATYKQKDGRSSKQLVPPVWCWHCLWQREYGFALLPGICRFHIVLRDVSEDVGGVVTRGLCIPEAFHAEYDRISKEVCALNVLS